MKCTIENCFNKIVAKGLCDKHRIRLKRWGNANYTKIEYFDSLEDYFFSKMGKLSQTDECINWKGKKMHSGYGLIAAKRNKSLAHRVSYEIHKGEIPKGMVICHKCDNPSCVNPSHLFLGTHNDNVQDMRNKGRNKNPPILISSKNPKTKLNERLVKNIRHEYQAGKLTTYKLAEKYKVSRQNISAIIKKEIWKYVE